MYLVFVFVFVCLITKAPMPNNTTDVIFVFLLFCWAPLWRLCATIAATFPPDEARCHPEVDGTTLCMQLRPLGFFWQFPRGFYYPTCSFNLWDLFLSMLMPPRGWYHPMHAALWDFFDKFPARSFSLLSPLYMERKVSTCHFRHTKLPRHILPTISGFSHLTTPSSRLHSHLTIKF